MMKIELRCDTGSGFPEEPAVYELEKLNSSEIELPEGTENIRLTFPTGNLILNLKSVQGYCGFWYDLGFTTEGFRLGHNLFLLQKPGTVVTGEDFRFRTTKVKFSLELIPLSGESAEKIAHDVSRLQSDRDELERKWKYQTQVYDEKVRDTVRLEKDKVELNEAIDELRGETEFWRSKYHEMEGSLSWRITEPIRSANATVKRLRAQGPLKQMKKAYLEELRNRPAATEGQPLFSLLSDVSGLSEEELYTFICRMFRQHYRNMELVLLGNGKLLTWFSSHDPRVRSIPSEMGLRGAVEASAGAYLGVLNVTDEILPETLEECVSAFSYEGVEMVYTDSDRFTERIEDADDPQFKPDFSPDYLRSCNYIGGFFAAKRELFANLPDFDGEVSIHNYGLLLKLTELANGRGEIRHILKKLYFEKKEKLPGVLLEARNDAALKALDDHLARLQLTGTPETLDKQQGLYHIRYELEEQPLISILIPNKDHVTDLKRCIDSVLRLSTYRHLEIVVVENNSAEKETFDFYKELESGYAERFSKIETKDGGRTLLDSGAPAERIDIRVVQWKEGFNFSAINNFGVPETKGEYLLLLNNDIEVITPGWIEEMLMYAKRPDVGAVGAKLYYTDDTVQHAGVIIGLGGVAAHSHLDFPKEAPGFMNRLRVVQNLSAVTAACLLMRRSVYEEIGGMDPGYQVAFNDADFCMRIRSRGYLIVFTPFAELHHDESKSRGVEDTPEKAERFESEVQRFKAEWTEILSKGDPYYNPNLTTREENFAVKD